MNGVHKVVALIPARAGSKNVPRKNLRELGGRSLLNWAIEVAKATPEIDRCVVSTDGDAIASEARESGAEVHVRPPELATDASPVLATIREVIRWLEPKDDNAQLVLLEPTAPLRTVEDIQRCLQALTDGADSAATFTEASLHPHRAFRLERGEPCPFIDGAVPWKPRQELAPTAYQLTGNVYAFWINRLPPDAASILFGRASAVMVPRVRAIDIDDVLDLELANALLRLDRGSGAL